MRHIFLSKEQHCILAIDLLEAHYQEILISHLLYLEHKLHQHICIAEHEIYTIASHLKSKEGLLRIFLEQGCENFDRGCDFMFCVYLLIASMCWFIAATG